MDTENARKLLAKYRQGSCTPREKMLVERWYLERAAELPSYTDDVMEREASRQERNIWQAIAERTGDTPPGNGWFNSFRSFLVAAAFILFAAAFAFYFITSGDQGMAAAHIAVKDIAPGSNKAVLALADGRTIDLDSAHTSIVVGKSEITYADGTSLHHADPDAEVQLLTLTTPRRGTYQVILPDGSKVWLNAGSTLTYPSRFDGSDREVELTGEGYFEVVRDTREVPLKPGVSARVGAESFKLLKPFIVKSKGQSIQVLGTTFNVAAYEDDKEIRTTLVEGSVKVKAANDTFTILKPGQQAVLDRGVLTTYKTNVESAVSWKEGDFIFENEPLESIMKKLERWYGVDIVYQGNPEGLHFYGMVSREKNIKSVLEVMEMTGKVKFRIEGTGADPEERRVVVML